MLTVANSSVMCCCLPTPMTLASGGSPMFPLVVQQPASPSIWPALMAGRGICVLCLADTCTSEVHPVFNPVAPYGYLLSDMYLFMADITNPDFPV